MCRTFPVAESFLETMNGKHVWGFGADNIMCQAPWRERGLTLPLGSSLQVENALSLLVDNPSFPLLEIRAGENFPQFRNQVPFQKELSYWRTTEKVPHLGNFVPFERWLPHPCWIYILRVSSSEQGSREREGLKELESDRRGEKRVCAYSANRVIEQVKSAKKAKWRRCFICNSVSIWVCSRFI